MNISNEELKQEESEDEYVSQSSSQRDENLVLEFIEKENKEKEEEQRKEEAID